MHVTWRNNDQLNTQHLNNAKQQVFQEHIQVPPGSPWFPLGPGKPGGPGSPLGPRISWAETTSKHHVLHSRTYCT